MFNVTCKRNKDVVCCHFSSKDFALDFCDKMIDLGFIVLEICEVTPDKKNRIYKWI